MCVCLVCFDHFYYFYIWQNTFCGIYWSGNWIVLNNRLPLWKIDVFFLRIWELPVFTFCGAENKLSLFCFVVTKCKHPVSFSFTYCHILKSLNTVRQFRCFMKCVCWRLCVGRSFPRCRGWLFSAAAPGETGTLSGLDGLPSQRTRCPESWSCHSLCGV